jgi:hypothetical protein
MPMSETSRIEEEEEEKEKRRFLATFVVRSLH